MSDIIRILRIVEYVGERSKVEEQVARSIHGTRGPHGVQGASGAVVISAVTLGEFPIGLVSDSYEAALLIELEKARERIAALERGDV